MKLNKDALFLVSGILVFSLIFGITYSYLEEKDKTIVNIISVIGSIVTILALAYSIYQQNQIKETSRQIEEHARNYEQRIRNNLYSWNISKSIHLIDRLEDLVAKDENFVICSFVLREIQGILGDCRKATLTHYSTDLESCLKKMVSPITQEQIDELIVKCKNNCKSEWEDKFTEYITEISAEVINLSKKIENDKNEFDRDSFRGKISSLKNYLYNIKPDVLT